MKHLHRMLAVPALVGGLLLTTVSSPLLAQAGTAPTAPATQRNAPASQQPSPAQDGAEARARLNAEQAQFAQNQVQTNSVSQEEYERQLKAVEDAKAKIASDAAAAQAAYDAERARRAGREL